MCVGINRKWLAECNRFLSSCDFFT